MTNTKELISQLKQVREEKQLSYNDILEIMEKNGDFLSKSTLSRVFAEGSENERFMYETTIRPIANALLDIENYEDTDSIDEKAMKSLLKYKIQRIEELEQQVEQLSLAVANEKVKYHEKLDEERAIFNDRIEFLKEQINYKDARMDMLLGWVDDKDAQNKEMLSKLLICSKCPMGTKNED